jgi:hypothetical protein
MSNQRNTCFIEISLPYCLHQLYQHGINRLAKLLIIRRCISLCFPADRNNYYVTYIR